MKLALARIKERVAQGGHHVPVKDVRWRFIKSFNNFFNDYKPLADHWSIIDNSKVPPQLIASGKSDSVEIFEKDLYQNIAEKGNHRD